LKTVGVPTQLVIYPGEGHAFIQPEHQRDVMERVLAWFDHYLKSKTTN
jgi:dipeptidyl aminopeptidase/acylaminoacyl peptidase